MVLDEKYVEMFLKDIPFYRNSQSFCLGNSFDHAGDIIASIINGREEADIYVGMDSLCTSETDTDCSI